jgi:hypothetical protein
MEEFRANIFGKMRAGTNVSLTIAGDSITIGASGASGLAKYSGKVGRGAYWPALDSLGFANPSAPTDTAATSTQLADTINTTIVQQGKANTAIQMRDSLNVAGTITSTGPVNGEPIWTWIVRTADTSHNNRGTGSPLFQFNMDANAMYEIEGKIFDTTAATTTSMCTFASVTGTVKGGTINVQNDYNATMGTDQLYTDQILLTSSATSDSSLPASHGVTGNQTMRIYGVIETNANARTFTFGIKSEVTGSAVVARKNSYLKYRKLPY